MGRLHTLFTWRLASSFSFCLWVVCFSTSATELPPCQRIDAAVRWSSDDKRYVFSGTEYIVYNDHYGVEEDVFPVSDIADDFPSHIDAAASWFGRRKSLYFKGCFVYTFNEETRKLRRRRTRHYGLPCDVDAAVNTGNDITVFKGCLFWRLTRTRRRAVMGGDTSELGLPCDVNAAVSWQNGTVYVIKDDVMWTLASDGSPARIAHIDSLSLCSWNICREGTAAGTDMGLLQDDFPCNGDQRFCSLRFDQVTLAGSHNAGSGFDGGNFMFLSCWVRNHYMSVLEQLRYGMRYLDVDPSWEHCGLLGTFHNFLCGGPVCRMIKQIKQFLQENRHEVVGINFNHEMRNYEEVLPALLRQLSSQLGQYLNSYRRVVGQWPSLGHAVRSNKRLFVIVDSRVEAFEAYRHHQWIHSERLLSSTWRADTTVEGNCNQVHQVARQQCGIKAGASLLEIAIFGTSTSCVTTIADLCLPLVHDVSRDCGKFRHAHGKAPNVLLVDFPERAPSERQSVVTAAYFQNVRNVARLRSGACQVRVDAAVTLSENGTQKVFLFSGDRVVVLDWVTKVQEAVRTTMGVTDLQLVDAVWMSADNLQLCVSLGCELRCRDSTLGNATVLNTLPSLGLPCHIDAAFTKQGTTYYFKGCVYWQGTDDDGVTGPQPITDFGVPCDVTVNAALLAPDGQLHFFTGDKFWTYSSTDGLSDEYDVLDWSADLVHCY